MGCRLGVSLIFIHGFLGQPSDWQPIAYDLPFPEMAFLDLNKEFSVSELHFQSWPAAFRRWLKSKALTKPLAVVGYSMGGRLALPLIEEGIVQQAVLVSSHWGLPEADVEARQQRYEQNKKWAARFAIDPWGQVLTDWNQQGVFAGSRGEPIRDEKNYDRLKLSALLTGFSLSHQKDYSSLPRRPGWRGLYISGALDKTYSDLAKKIEGPSLQKLEIPKAGHRVPWDEPPAVRQALLEFFKS